MDIKRVRFDYETYKKLSHTENNPHLRKHYEEKMVKAKAELRRMSQNDSSEKPLRTPWKRMHIRSDYFESTS